MQKFWNRTAAIVTLAVTALILQAQNSANRGLVIQINPESHLDTPQASLSFQVNNPGEIVYSQPVTVTAWMRALPNRQIQLTAQPQSLAGPSDAAPVASLRWTATMSGATGGATAASCIGGDFGSSGPQQLIENWTQSGIAKCTVTFALATGATWPAGVYSGAVSLILTAK
jgi:hypothetical protein